MYRQFLTEIAAMNHTYKLPQVEPTAADFQFRAKQFKKILTDELSEIDELTGEANDLVDADNMTSADYLRLLTGMADLLGDLIVFCASEAARYNLPIEGVLRIIMQSNFSKLGADGEPIIDADGKFQKGPNYWKPEPQIARLIAGFLEDSGKPLAEQPVVAINMDVVAAAALNQVQNVSGTDPTAVPGVNWNADGSPTSVNPMVTRVDTTQAVVAPTQQPDSGSQAVASNP